MKYSNIALLLLALSDVARPQSLKAGGNENKNLKKEVKDPVNENKSPRIGKESKPLKEVKEKMPKKKDEDAEPAIEKKCYYNDDFEAAQICLEERDIVNGTISNITRIETPPRDDDRLKSEESDPCDIPPRNPLVPDDPNDFQDYRYDDGRRLQAFNAVIWKVRACNNFLCFGSSLTKAEFQHWENANVSNGNQKDTYIANLREPNPSQTRRLVLLLAGQNGFSNIIGGGVGDMVSGSHNNWHSGWSSTLANRVHPVMVNSWAYEFFYKFNDQETFVATSWATSFNWGTSTGEKQDIEDAFYNWLLSKVGNIANLKEVILAGHSRGACLALRLAARFNSNFAPNVDVAVMAADPICKVGQSEFGAAPPSIPNPFVPGWIGTKTDMRVQFQKEGRQLYVENYVVGDAMFVLPTIRGLSDKRAFASPFNMGGWYHQFWITWGHTAADDWTVWMGNDPLTFCQDASDWFAAECPNPCPHGGMYDSVHCYVGSPPVGTTAFVWGGNYYYTPVGTNGCPMTGSWYDGANCYVGDAPDDEDPFVWSNSWYYHPNWEDNSMCYAQWTGWYDRDNSSGQGDYEQRSQHSPTPCGGATPVDVQCHVVGAGFVDAWSTGEDISCDINGLVCKNADQPDNSCDWDYKVRYLCP